RERDRGVGRTIVPHRVGLEQAPKFVRTSTSSTLMYLTAPKRNQTSVYRCPHLGRGYPNPVLAIAEASAPENVLKEVMIEGFLRPMPVQSQGWPMALGRYVMGISSTGFGETLTSSFRPWSTSTHRSKLL
ncbi:unnamed protein product, partial [Discosporangium mesarthrocarpum]